MGSFRSGARQGQPAPALSDLRKSFGDEFNDVLITSQSFVQLSPDRWEMTGGPADGDLLEGTGLQEPGLRDWLNQMREPGLSPAAFRPSLVGEAAARTSIRPSIAVVPFQLVSGTKDQARLGDLVAQEISRALSRSKLIDVISHLSCRNLDARALELSEIRQLLGSDYILYGNYRTDGLRVRLDVDFVSAASGHILWTGLMKAQSKSFAGVTPTPSFQSPSRPAVPSSAVHWNWPPAPPAQCRQPCAVHLQRSADAPSGPAQLFFSAAPNWNNW
jgi:TolB-like protein